MREAFLPFALPLIDESEIDEVVDTLKSGWITTGPKTKQFEQLFREYIGCSHAVALNSCTAGLHLSLAAAGVGPGDEVITTPFTFCASVNVIVHCGATPVLVDISPDDYNIDPGEIAKKLTPRTKAIVPVHYGGQPCRMDEIMAIAAEHNLLVIEDAAHAAGARYKDRMVGTIGDAASFSFYATKNMTTAEGGMVTTNNAELAEKISVLGLHGIDHDAWRRYTAEGSWYYEVVYPGFKYNMTDIQASLGIHQLAKLEEAIRIRERYCRVYDDGFGDVPEIIIPSVREEVCHARHLYPIRIHQEMLRIDRAQFIAELRAENIGTSVHFIPVHLHPYYRERFGFCPGDFPVAEAVYEGLITLPLYPKMSMTDVHDVIEAVRGIVARNRR